MNIVLDFYKNYPVCKLLVVVVIIVESLIVYSSLTSETTKSLEQNKYVKIQVEKILRGAETINFDEVSRDLGDEIDVNEETYDTQHDSAKISRNQLFESQFGKAKELVKAASPKVHTLVEDEELKFEGSEKHEWDDDPEVVKLRKELEFTQKFKERKILANRLAYARTRAKQKFFEKHTHAELLSATDSPTTRKPHTPGTSTEKSETSIPTEIPEIVSLTKESELQKYQRLGNQYVLNLRKPVNKEALPEPRLMLTNDKNDDYRSLIRFYGAKIKPFGKYAVVGANNQASLTRNAKYAFNTYFTALAWRASGFGTIAIFGGDPGIWTEVEPWRTVLLEMSKLENVTVVLWPAPAKYSIRISQLGRIFLANLLPPELNNTYLITTDSDFWPLNKDYLEMEKGKDVLVTNPANSANCYTGGLRISPIL